MDMEIKFTDTDECTPTVINDFIAGCTKNGTLCIACPCWRLIENNLIIKHFFSEKELENISNSERHSRCLCLFFSSLNIVLSKEQLTEHVWPGSIVGPSSLPVLIHELRVMLKESNFKLVNSRGRGYVLINIKTKGGSI
ncbi:winged helix-turn-helix domain-containing protein [Aeromonas hydrophila]|uniref:winged helix-turn-helix domain-containing protein n=1 Tax=Aeromonas hydrophila TaxID=644 RepID=UPI001378CC4A|nr:winged helix-turn-helix domain-containing protein [Aeromonas hydrophila]